MKNVKIWAFIVVAFVAGMMVSPMIFKKNVTKEESAKAHEEEGAVKVNKDSQELMNLGTIEVKKAPLVEKIPVTGQIAQDVEQTNNVNAPVAGVVIENTAQLGAVIKKGDVLCRIKPNDQDQVIDVKSPYEGVVIGDFDKVGEKVETVSALCAIADLSKVYANFDVYEKDIAKVKVGQKIVVHSSAYLQDAFEGKIVFISPRVDDTTRTVKIRTEIDNSKYLLKLGMFVNGDILFESADEYLVIPISAIQTLGEEKIVFLKGENDAFHKKVIQIKSQTTEQAAVSEGLKAGDYIVTQGSFLLKSGLLKDELEGE